MPPSTGASAPTLPVQPMLPVTSILHFPEPSTPPSVTKTSAVDAATDEHPVQPPPEPLLPTTSAGKVLELLRKRPAPPSSAEPCTAAFPEVPSPASPHTPAPPMEPAKPCPTELRLPSCPSTP